jgi:DNA-binding FadR family transcriptional regulator
MISHSFHRWQEAEAAMHLDDHEHRTDGAAAELVVSHVRGQIERGELKPGDRLPPERELAQLVGVSRPSVRAGLRSLSAMGVVHTRHGSGTYIADGPPALDSRPLSMLASLHGFTPEQMFEARRVLEVGVAGLAAERATGDQVAAMAEEVTGMFASVEDPQTFLMHDVRFHRSVAMASGIRSWRRWWKWCRRSTSSSAASRCRAAAISGRPRSPTVASTTPCARTTWTVHDARWACTCRARGLRRASGRLQIRIAPDRERPDAREAQHDGDRAPDDQPAALEDSRPPVATANVDSTAQVRPRAAGQCGTSCPRTSTSACAAIPAIVSRRAWHQYTHVSVLGAGVLCRVRCFVPVPGASATSTREPLHRTAPARTAPGTSTASTGGIL